jgi:hypothetical protein
MNSENTLPPLLAPSAEKMGDHYKLVSLLALASGAVAMPQTSNADIIYTNLSSPVQVGYYTSSFFLVDNLPGIAQLAFQTVQRGSTSFTSSRFVVVGQYDGYVRLKTNAYFAVRASQGKLWTQIPGTTYSVGTAGAANLYNHFPDSFNNEYYAFIFQDSTHGSALRYGWVEVSLENSNLAVGDGPNLTIFGWGYDAGGAQIAMGAIPEPSAAAVAALGALALGAKGLRSWRRNRVAAGEP